MRLSIACPACGRALQLPASYRTQTVQCGLCGHTFRADSASVLPDVRAADEEALGPAFADEPERFQRPPVPNRGGTILALAVVALLVPCTAPVCGPLAWTLANSDLAQIEAGRRASDGAALVRLGRGLAVLALVLCVGEIVAASLFLPFF